MTSFVGEKLKLSLFGESHGPGIGFVLDGLPPGIPFDVNLLELELKRRRPRPDGLGTARREMDTYNVLSGVYNGRLTGTPLAICIENHDTQAADYGERQRIPRPGHADLTSLIRYNGAADPRGGGHFSGRISAAVVAAGAVARMALKPFNIEIAGHIERICDLTDRRIHAVGDSDILALRSIARNGIVSLPVLDETIAGAMADCIRAAAEDGDSIGGAVELAALNYPAGIGSPWFGGLEPRLSRAFFAIPGVTAVEFGAGTEAASSRGSDYNDCPEFRDQAGRKLLRFKSNHCGGVHGGISNGMPILARVCIKPTPSIAKEQETVDLQRGKNTRIRIQGRHDPCIVPRALPVVEAMMALTLLDLLLESGLPAPERTAEGESQTGEERTNE